jgi:hypothetical protein
LGGTIDSCFRFFVVQQSQEAINSPLVAVPSESGYNIEHGRNNVVYSTSKLLIEESDTDIHYYRDNFYKKGKRSHIGRTIVFHMII